MPAVHKAERPSFAGDMYTRDTNAWLLRHQASRPSYSVFTIESSQHGLSLEPLRPSQRYYSGVIEP